MNNSLHITLVGCGKMGAAMVRGWQASDLSCHVTVIEPGALPSDLKTLTHIPTPSEDVKDSDIIVLAVKPQVMAQACKALKPFIAPDALILSIAAGQTLGNFADYFGSHQPAIRAMPNTPAAIGKGISVLVANTQVSEKQKTQADQLMETSGPVEWVDEEEAMNAVTALSGSGPAYVFLMIEVMARAGEKAGLHPDLAMKLARQTVIGAAALAENDPGLPAEILRKNVTSPGGTTEAALKVLMNGEFQDLMNKAIAAAKARGEELS